MRTRSFRNEDYNNRRAFLRSYPLYGGGDQDEDVKAESAKAATGSTSRKPVKEIILAVFHWGGERAIILRRFKHKVNFYVISCLPVGLRTRTALISV